MTAAPGLMPAATAGPQVLTARERQVLELMSAGRTNASIGQYLYISAGAVEKHITSIYTKLCLESATGGHRRVLAVLQWLDASKDVTGVARNGRVI